MPRETRTNEALADEIVKRQAARQRTSFFVPLPEMRALNDAGMLTVQPFDGGLYIFARRRGAEDVYYFLDPEASPVPPEKAGLPLLLTLTRLASAPQDPPQSTWEALGFKPYITRTRFVLTKDKLPQNRIQTYATQAHLDEIYELLTGYYEPLASFVPTKAELSSYIDAKRVIIAEENGTFRGFMHFEQMQKTCFLWHLVVNKKGCGYGKKLMLDACGIPGVSRTLLWVQDNNTGARELYERLGFTRDGRVTAVLKMD